MKRFKGIISLFAVALFAAGCIDNGSPKGAITSAGSAVKTGNIKDLQKLLGGEALQTYGTPEGMQILNEKLAPYSKLYFGREQIIKSEYGHQGYGFYGDVLRLYELDVLGQTASGNEAHVMTAQVTCHVFMRAEQYLGGCNTWNQGTPCNHTTSYTEAEHCKITRISDIK